jgi:dehydrogenase/reductase SDR family member 12
MPIVKETVTTSMPIEAAFAYVADFENIVEWDPGVIAARKTTNAPAAVGVAYDLDLNYGGSDMAMTYTITEFDPPRLVILEGDGPRSGAVDRIAFTSVDGGTRIDYEADIRLKGLFRFAEPFLGGLFDRVGEGARAGLDRRLGELAANGKGV